MARKIRCFIGIKFSKQIIDEIEKIQNELKQKDLFYGKFTSLENLHLTLKFLGEVSEEDVEKIGKKLEGVKVGNVAGVLGRVGVFSEKFIRIVWMEVLGERVFELQKKIDNALDGMFEKESRFMSHLTIARVKSVKDKKLFLEGLGKIKLNDSEFDIDKFYLIKSELSEGGPRYSVLKEYDLENIY